MQKLLFERLKEEKHIVSLVGAGGKTTIMYQLAEDLAKLGKKVLVTTTTHIWKPARNFAEALSEVEDLWNKGTYAVAGSLEENTGKLIQLPKDIFQTYSDFADVVLIEADGAKGLPCKAPAENEPVLLEESDIVIAVMGLDALNEPVSEVCFRLEKVQELLQVTAEHKLNEENLVKLLLSEQGACKNVGQRDFYIVLNKCDTLERRQGAERICTLLQEKGFSRDKLWIRGEA